MSADPRSRTVQAVYDELGPHFGEWMSRLVGEPLDRLLGQRVSKLDEGSRILEIGCGDGRTARRLVERFEVVGVDLSEKQLQLACAAAPGATFLLADIMELDFPVASYDAVTAFYSFMHIPRDRHPDLLARIRRWLKPGGLFLAPMSTLGGPDRTERWLGVDMFFSGWDAETNARLVREAGFEVLVDEVIEMWEPASEYETSFLWVLAQRST